jgi:hypothetical protein
MLWDLDHLDRREYVITGTNKLQVSGRLEMVNSRNL